MVIYSGFSHWKLWFSIAMLVYQRVTIFNLSFNFPIFRRLSFGGVAPRPPLRWPCSSVRRSASRWTVACRRRGTAWCIHTIHTYIIIYIYITWIYIYTHIIYIYIYSFCISMYHVSLALLSNIYTNIEIFIMHVCIDMYHLSLARSIDR